MNFRTLFANNHKTYKLLAFFTIAVATFNVFDKYGNSNMVLILLTAIIISLCYRRILNLNIMRRENIIAGFYSVFLSLAVIAGHEVNYSEMRSGIHENYINLDISWVLASFSLAILIFPLLVNIIELIKKNRINELENPVINIKPFFIASWIIIFIAWVPYLLTFYPAGIVGDGAETLEYSLQGGIPANNHWVVIYILILKLFIHIGRLFSQDINVALFLYAISSSVVYSAVCAVTVATIRKKGAPRLIVYASLGVYALSGFFASYSISLWKDGIFSAAVVLLVLLFWDYPKDERVSISYCIKFASISLFICFWRNNGIYVLILCIAGVLILLQKRAKRLVATGIAVVCMTLVIQGPIYSMLGIGKDSLIESISVPLQQIAAVVSEGGALSDEQSDIIYSIMPKETWIENYCPTLSDDIRKSADIVYLQNHFGDFLEIWAQLLIPNFSIYVKAYLMQMLGFWQPGVFQGNYWDYWLGIQDIHNRGYQATDLIQGVSGISLEKLLLDRMGFIPSGTMVWLLLFSGVVIACQGSYRRKRMLVMLPLIASWGIIMIASPIAYAYRYIVMIPMAFPVIFLLPFIDESKKQVIYEPDNRGNCLRTINVKILCATFVIVILGLCVNVGAKIHVIERYRGGEFVIHLAGDEYNASDYVKSGLSGNEGMFSWTDGDLVSFEIPVSDKFLNLQVDLSVAGTFNGEKSYVIKQKEDIISKGSINGSGEINFYVMANDGKLKFDLYLPDAEVINEVQPENYDSRKVSLQLIKITISE